MSIQPHLFRHINLTLITHKKSHANSYRHGFFCVQLNQTQSTFLNTKCVLLRFCKINRKLRMLYSK